MAHLAIGDNHTITAAQGMDRAGHVAMWTGGALDAPEDAGAEVQKNLHGAA